MKVVCGIKVGNMKDPDETKRGKVGIVDFAVKPVGPEEVKIKVAYCSICGSDPHIVGAAFGLEPPFGLGHEMSGVIVELGERAGDTGLKVGDHVGGNFLHYCGSCYYCKTGNPEYCENAGNEPCMVEYVVWHKSQVVKLPAETSFWPYLIAFVFMGFALNYAITAARRPRAGFRRRSDRPDHLPAVQKARRGLPDPVRAEPGALRDRQEHRRGLHGRSHERGPVCARHGDHRGAWL